MYYELQNLIASHMGVACSYTPSLEDWCKINGIKITEISRYSEGDEEAHHSWTEYKVGDDLIISTFNLGGDQEDYGFHGENLEKHLGGYIDDFFKQLRKELTGSNVIPYYFYMDDLPDYPVYEIPFNIEEGNWDNIDQYIENELNKKFGKIPESYYFRGIFNINGKQYTSFESRTKYDSIVPESTIIVQIK